ncbi:hypothetical protein CDAR_612291 [Caerostris darwini]|uniref:Uncharacterized protein n=1 Tax=Caerostris darwini TaxID=1538125 RepID=A0AAV4S0P7_9ARAC|nr:hypothetical protein CDAR_612291 [Caerostris darwini]
MEYITKHSPKSSTPSRSRKEIFEIFLHFRDNDKEYKFNDTRQQKSNRSNDIRHSLIKQEKIHESTDREETTKRIIPTENIGQKLLSTNIPKEHIIYRNFGSDNSTSDAKEKEELRNILAIKDNRSSIVKSWETNVKSTERDEAMDYITKHSPKPSTPSISTKEIFEIFLHFRDNRKEYKFNESIQQKSNRSNDISNSLITQQEEKFRALTDREETTKSIMPTKNIGQKLLSSNVSKDHIIYRYFGPNNSKSIVKEKEELREISPNKDNRNKTINSSLMYFKSTKRSETMKHRAKDSQKSSNYVVPTKPIFEIFLHFRDNKEYKFNQQKQNKSDDNQISLKTKQKERFHSSTDREETTKSNIPIEKIGHIVQEEEESRKKIPIKDNSSNIENPLQMNLESTERNEAMNYKTRHSPKSSTKSISTKAIFEIFLHFRDNDKEYKFNDTRQQKSNRSNDIRHSLIKQEKIHESTDREETSKRIIPTENIGQKLLSTNIPKEHIIYRNFGSDNSTSDAKEKEELRNILAIKDNRSSIVKSWETNVKSTERDEAMDYITEHSPKSSTPSISTKELFEIFLHFRGNRKEYKFNETSQQKSNRSNDISNSLITVKDKKNRASTHQQDNTERIIPTEKIAQKLFPFNKPDEHMIYRNFAAINSTSIVKEKVESKEKFPIKSNKSNIDNLLQMNFESTARNEAMNYITKHSSKSSTPRKEIFEIFLHFRDNKKEYKFNDASQRKSNRSHDIRNSLITKQEERIHASTDLEEATTRMIPTEKIGQKSLSTNISKEDIIYRNFEPINSTSIVKEKEEPRQIFYTKDNRNEYFNSSLMNFISTKRSEIMKHRIKDAQKSSTPRTSPKEIFEIFLHFRENRKEYKLNEINLQKINKINDIRDSLMTKQDEKIHASTDREGTTERIIPTEKIGQKSLSTNVSKEHIIYRNFGPNISANIVKEKEVKDNRNNNVNPLQMNFESTESNTAMNYIAQQYPKSSTASISTKEIFEIFLHFRDNDKEYKFNETSNQKSNRSNDIINSLITKQEAKIHALTDREETTERIIPTEKIGQKLWSSNTPKERIIYRNFAPNSSASVDKEKEDSTKIFQNKNNRSKPTNSLQMIFKSAERNEAMIYKTRKSPKSSTSSRSTKEIFEIFLHFRDNRKADKFNETSQHKSNKSNVISKSLLTKEAEKTSNSIIATEKIGQKVLFTNVPKEGIIYRNFETNNSVGEEKEQSLESFRTEDNRSNIINPLERNSKSIERDERMKYIFKDSPKYSTPSVSTKEVFEIFLHFRDNRKDYKFNGTGQQKSNRSNDIRNSLITKEDEIFHLLTDLEETTKRIIKTEKLGQKFLSTIVPNNSIIYRNHGPKNSINIAKENEETLFPLIETSTTKDNRRKNISHSLRNSKFINGNRAKHNTSKDYQKSFTPAISTKGIFEIFIHLFNDTKGYKFGDTFLQNINKSKDINNTLMYNKEKYELDDSATGYEKNSEKIISSEKFGHKMLSNINPKNHIIYRNFETNNSKSIVKEKEESNEIFQTKDNMRKPIDTPLIKPKSTKKGGATKYIIADSDLQIEPTTPVMATKEIFEIFIHFLNDTKGYRSSDIFQQNRNKIKDISNPLTTRKEIKEQDDSVTHDEEYLGRNISTKEFRHKMLSSINPKNHIIYRNFGPNNSTSIVKEKKESRKAFQTKDNMSKPINIPLIESKTTKKGEATEYIFGDSDLQIESTTPVMPPKEIFEIFIHFPNDTKGYRSGDVFWQNSNKVKDISNLLTTKKKIKEQDNSLTDHEEFLGRNISTKEFGHTTLSTINPKDRVIYRNFVPSNSKSIVKEKDKSSETFQNKDNISSLKSVKKSEEMKYIFVDSHKSTIPVTPPKEIFEIFIYFLNDTKVYRSGNVFWQNSNKIKDNSNPLATRKGKKELDYSVTDHEKFPGRNISTEEFGHKMLSTMNPKDHIIYRNFAPRNSTNIVKEKEESREIFQTKNNMSEPINTKLIKSKSTKKSGAKKYIFADSRKSTTQVMPTKEIFEIFIHFPNDTKGYRSGDVFWQNSNKINDISGPLINRKGKKEPDDSTNNRAKIQQLDNRIVKDKSKNNIVNLNLKSLGKELLQFLAKFVAATENESKTFHSTFDNKLKEGKDLPISLHESNTSNLIWKHMNQQSLKNITKTTVARVLANMNFENKTNKNLNKTEEQMSDFSSNDVTTLRNFDYKHRKKLPSSREPFKTDNQDKEDTQSAFQFEQNYKTNNSLAMNDYINLKIKEVVGDLEDFVANSKIIDLYHTKEKGDTQIIFQLKEKGKPLVKPVVKLKENNKKMKYSKINTTKWLPELETVTGKFDQSTENSQSKFLRNTNLKHLSKGISMNNFTKNEYFHDVQRIKPHKNKTYEMNKKLWNLNETSVSNSKRIIPYEQIFRNSNVIFNTVDIDKLRNDTNSKHHGLISNKNVSKMDSYLPTYIPVTKNYSEKITNKNIENENSATIDINKEHIPIKNMHFKTWKDMIQDLFAQEKNALIGHKEISSKPSTSNVEKSETDINDKNIPNKNMHFRTWKDVFQDLFAEEKNVLTRHQDLPSKPSTSNYEKSVTDIIDKNIPIKNLHLRAWKNLIQDLFAEEMNMLSTYQEISPKPSTSDHEKSPTDIIDKNIPIKNLHLRAWKNLIQDLFDEEMSMLSTHQEISYKPSTSDYEKSVIIDKNIPIKNLHFRTWKNLIQDLFAEEMNMLRTHQEITSKPPTSDHEKSATDIIDKNIPVNNLNWRTWKNLTQDLFAEEMSMLSTHQENSSKPSTSDYEQSVIIDKNIPIKNLHLRAWKNLIQDLFAEELNMLSTPQEISSKASTSDHEKSATDIIDKNIPIKNLHLRAWKNLIQDLFAEELNMLSTPQEIASKASTSDHEKSATDIIDKNIPIKNLHLRAWKNLIQDLFAEERDMLSTHQEISSKPSTSDYEKSVIIDKNIPMKNLHLRTWKI